MTRTDLPNNGRGRILHSAKLGLLAGVISGILLIVVGIAADPDRGPNIVAPFVYLVGSFAVFTTIAIHAARGRPDIQGVSPAFTVGVVGPWIPFVISLVASDSGESAVVQALELLVLVWIPALLGVLAGIVVTMVGRYN